MKISYVWLLFESIVLSTVISFVTSLLIDGMGGIDKIAFIILMLFLVPMILFYKWADIQRIEEMKKESH